jgi:hypothetical protein
MVGEIKKIEAIKITIDMVRTNVTMNDFKKHQVLD